MSWKCLSKNTKGIHSKEPPYAERHVRWCERSENESRKKTTSFSSYSIIYSFDTYLELKIKTGSVEISWGLFFILVRYCLLRIMKNDYLNMLASLVLPAQILDYFLISGVEQTSQEIHISLDEKMNSKLSNDEHFESKGFMEAVNVTDFPIRDHKVILKIRRRRWTDLRAGKSFSIPIDLDVVAKGTRYSKEFGAFLKETYGDIPSDLPYA